MLLIIPGVLVDGTSPVTATPARSDINVYQGVDTTVQVSVTGSNGAAFNLTGYTATMVVKDRVLPTSGQPRTSLSYSGTISSPTTGVITFSVPGSDLKALQLVGYWWDVFVTSGANKRDEVVPTGTMTVNVAVGA